VFIGRPSLASQTVRVYSLIRFSGSTGLAVRAKTARQEATRTAVVLGPITLN
jgi:hypothetical protein